MKKYFIFLFIFAFLFGGCSISYSSNIDSDKENETEESNKDSGDNNENDENNNDNTSNIVVPSIPGVKDINAPTSIDENAYFYPYTLTKASPKIEEYSYIDEKKASKYQIYSAYYSEYYDTLYIAYDSTINPTQTLKAKDLYQIERHALYYFDTDNNKTDYKDYLKAVLIYPDTLASSCRKNLSDDSSLDINGCANYVGKEAIISLNRLASLEHFYNKRKEYINEGLYRPIEAMRYTFAHEFGHISTFYNMIYKSDEDYEDYLKLRLGETYSIIYKNGLPSSYSSQNDSYYTQPTEILADDYVELFYNTSEKVEEDTYNYTLNAGYSRNSLKNFQNVQNLSQNEDLYAIVKSYYINNFLDYSTKNEYIKPVVITSERKLLQYYKSYSEIGNIENIKTINISLPQIYLIAVGETTINNQKYYRVILSNTFNMINNSYDEKETGKKMGYVLASSYQKTNNIKLYAINYYKKEETMLGKYNMVQIKDYTDTYILPYYDFSYVINLSSSNEYATMYDYLNNKISNQTYQVHTYSFGTEIK